MTLHAPTHRREKILGFGLPGSGKTSAILDVAKWLHGSPDTIYAANTDYKWAGMYPEDWNVRLTQLDQLDFDPWRRWARDIRPHLKPDDWVCFDLADAAWEAAQHFYWDKITGGDMLADVWFRNQEAINSKGKDGEYIAGSNGANWGLIKRYYWECIQPVLNVPCHVMMLAQAKEVPSFSVHTEALKAKWKTGWMPTGEKKLPEQFLTWLYFAETTNGYIATTIRDNSPIADPKRDRLKGQDMEGGFVMNYLIPVAGWQV
jgi:hypothetical protein